MSPSKLHRIISGGNVKAFKIEELQAFADMADEDSEVTLESLAKLNGMRNKDAESEINIADIHMRRSHSFMFCTYPLYASELSDLYS